MEDKGKTMNLETKDRTPFKSLSLRAHNETWILGPRKEQQLSYKNATQASADIEYTEPEIASLLLLHKNFTHLASQLELKSYEWSLFVNLSEQNEHHHLSKLVRAME